jgi:hypothetical protein
MAKTFSARLEYDVGLSLEKDFMEFFPFYKFHYILSPLLIIKTIIHT